MDWANERYVRLFTRDTPEWLCMEWQGRALWPHLIRKADRSGVLANKLGARGIAVLVALPIEVVEAGLASLLADGCLRDHPLGFVIPNFIEAQETPQSDAMRQRESRERRRSRPRDDGGQIYVVRSSTRGVKIGFTAGAVEDRVRQLETGGGEVLSIIRVFEGTPTDERELHDRFREHRRLGEWFNECGSLAEWVSQTTECHAASRGVTSGHAVSRSVTPDQTRPDQTSPIQKGEIPDAPAEPAPSRPALLLIQEPAKRTRGRKPEFQCSEDERAAALRVLVKLGDRNGTAYTGCGAHLKLIVGRMRDGIPEMDLRKVIAFCADGRKWEDDPKMRVYLTPETLFGPETIHKYLDQARSWATRAYPDQERATP